MKIADRALRQGLAAATCVMLLQGCMQSETRGTYRVEIEIAGVAAPIEGTLILSTSALDVPPPTDADRASLGEWFEHDTIDANSCFILHTGTGEKAIPRNVRVFEAQIRTDEVELPLEIYRTPLQRIEIIGLEFFANAIGGDVVLHDQGEQRPGRIYGSRSGAPTRQRCLDDLETFRTSLRDSLADQEDDGR